VWLSLIAIRGFLLSSFFSLGALSSIVIMLLYWLLTKLICEYSYDCLSDLRILLANESTGCSGGLIYFSSAAISLAVDNNTKLVSYVVLTFEFFLSDSLLN